MAPSKLTKNQILHYNHQHITVEWYVYYLRDNGKLVDILRKFLHKHELHCALRDKNIIIYFL